MNMGMVVEDEQGAASGMFSSVELT